MAKKNTGLLKYKSKNVFLILAVAFFIIFSFRGYFIKEQEPATPTQILGTVAINALAAAVLALMITHYYTAIKLGEWLLGKISKNNAPKTRKQSSKSG